jgi:hypothetical protein
MVEHPIKPTVSPAAALAGCGHRADPRVDLEIALKAGCDVRTARKYREGRDPRSRYLTARLAEACRSLNVDRDAPMSSPAAA